MQFTKRFLIISLSALVLFQSCKKDLDLVPTNDITGESVFKNAAGYKQAMAKMYAGLAVTGSPGRDIPSEIVSDEGSTGFLRQLWYLQCLSTDEAGWTYSNNTDPLGIHQMTWSASNQAVAGLYYRCFYNVTLSNNFLQESTDDKLSSRGIAGADADLVRSYREDAKFLRAYNYWVLLDNFGSVPFSDESLKIGSGVLPKQKSKVELFSFLESELKALEATLPAPRSSDYGRADKGAAWALLARMYLNAQVYTGTAKYTEAITYSSKVINAGYSLHPNFKELMLADNHDLGKTEFIWAIAFNGTNTQAWSGTTFLVHGPAGVPGSVSGTNGSWNCMRITEQFVDKFGALDIRGQFWTTGQTKNMDVLLGLATSGYSSTKFTNKTRSGALPVTADAAGNHTDVDFPVFRLAEMYLTYAEAVVRGGSGGSSAIATSYLQALARRGRPADANANAFVELTLPYILDERGRELFWECQRRTDLIRYNLFTTGTYLWSWKGNVRNGTAVDPKFNIYPIPAIDLSTNPNIKQNAGY